MMRSHEVATRLRIWLVLACCSLLTTACLTTYDTEGEEFVEGCEEGAVESCNGIDDNCDGNVDEGCDDDGDLYCDASMTVEGSPSVCSNGGNDCNDDDAAINPGAAERCSGVDETCNGTADEGCDEDGDGYCAAGADIVYSQDGSLPAVCSNGINDCDDTDVTLTSPLWYRDTDGDGFGVDSDTQETCTPDSGYVDAGGDCDDADPAAFPDNPEICDGIDNDCDNDTDEEATDATTWYADTDLDGYGDPDVSVTACDTPVDHVEDNTDCDDTLASAYPGAPELCDDALNDCAASEADAGCNDDGDDHCDATMTVEGNPAICTAGGGDCNDDDPNVHPNAPEICAPQDFDCDNVPGVLGLNTTVARGQTPTGVGEDMAFNGSIFGVVWAEEGETTRVGRFAEVDEQLQVLSNVELTMPTRAVYDIAVAWDPTSSTWGIAYNALDQGAGTWVVGLIRLDTTKTVVADEILDTDTGTTTVRVVAAGDYFGVVYEKTEPGGDRDVYYAPYQISTDSARPPNLAAQNRYVSSMTMAYRGANNALYMLWTSSGNQYFAGAVRADNGSNYSSFTTRAMPTVVTAANNHTLHVIGDSLYMIYEDTTPASPNPDLLHVVPLTTSLNISGGTSITPKVIATDPYTSSRAVMTDGTYIVVMWRSVAAAYEWVFSRYDTSWNLVTEAVVGDFSVSYNKGPVFPSAKSGNYWTFFNQDTDNGFFRMVQLTNSGSEARNREPISATPYTSPLHRESSQRRIRYDEASDRFLVLQEDPAQDNVLQMLYINRDGTTTQPVTLGPYPEGCNPSPSSFVDYDGNFLCITRQFDDTLCTLTSRVVALDAAGEQFVELDVSTWPTFDGSCSNNEWLETHAAHPVGPGYGTLWRRPDYSLWLRVTTGSGTTNAFELLGPPPLGEFDVPMERSLYGASFTTLPDGSVALVLAYELIDFFTFSDQEFRIEAIKIEPGVGISAPLTLFLGEDFNGWADMRFAGLLGDNLAVLAAESIYDPNTSMQSNDLVVHTIDPVTWALGTDLIIASGSSTVSVSAGRARVLDGRLLVPWRESDYSAGIRNGHLAFVEPDGSVASFQVAEKLDDIYGVYETGVSGYYGVFLNKPVGGEIVVLDESGATITSAGMAFSTVDSLYVEQFDYTGSDFLALVRSSSRLFIVDATCSGSSSGD